MTFQHQTTSGTNPDDRRRGVSTLTGYRYYADRLEAEIAELKDRLANALADHLMANAFADYLNAEKLLPGVPHPEGPVPHSDPPPWHPDHHDDAPVVAALMFDGRLAW